MAANKNFFWHEILSLNELGSHAFVDVKIKKNAPDAPNAVGIFTSEFPLHVNPPFHPFLCPNGATPECIKDPYGYGYMS
jgi:hypothetical protein